MALTKAQLFSIVNGTDNKLILDLDLFYPLGPHNEIEESVCS